MGSAFSHRSSLFPIKYVNELIPIFNNVELLQEQKFQEFIDGVEKMYNVHIIFDLEEKKKMIKVIQHEMLYGFYLTRIIYQLVSENDGETVYQV